MNQIKPYMVSNKEIEKKKRLEEPIANVRYVEKNRSIVQRRIFQINSKVFFA